MYEKFFDRARRCARGRDQDFLENSRLSSAIDDEEFSLDDTRPGFESPPIDFVAGAILRAAQFSFSFTLSRARCPFPYVVDARDPLVIRLVWYPFHLPIK